MSEIRTSRLACEGAEITRLLTLLNLFLESTSGNRMCRSSSKDEFCVIKYSR